MVRYLINRPIGTCVVALTLTLLGFFATSKLPVSLMPEIPVPEITVQANYLSADAKQMQQLIAIPMRNQLLQLTYLDDLEAISNDGQTVFKLRYDYGTDINLAFLEAQEKIDVLMETLPRDMLRPRVIKAGASDIPVFQLNVSFKEKNGDFLQLSSFSENILKRRIEQLSEVALVDLTGLAKPEVRIQPNLNVLNAIGITLDDLKILLENQIGEIGNVVVREGQNEYSIRFEATLRNIDDINNLQLRLGSAKNFRIIQLKQLATVTIREQREKGLFTFNGKRSVGMSIVKQNNAQILGLKSQLQNLITEFEKEYPDLLFNISQDQTELLDLSISNLYSSLIIGALLSFVMIFFFMKNHRIPIMIGILIPISISITFLGFYLLGLSINIVSLAGLVLGIGEIVDSAIIIIESIEQRRSLEISSTPESIAKSCISGTQDVIGPLFTSVLTNSAVFLPLLFLSGIAGALFFDQAVAVSLSLGISLLASYTLIPVLYFNLSKNQTNFKLQSTKASRSADRIYSWVFNLAFHKPYLMLTFWLFLIMAAILIMPAIDKSGMPSISRIENETYINWNEPVSAVESNRRLSNLVRIIPNSGSEISFYVGQQQYLLSTRLNHSSSESLIIIRSDDSEKARIMSSYLNDQIASVYPQATFQTRPSLNVFEQLFRTSDAPLRYLISGVNSQHMPELATMDSVIALLNKNDCYVQPVALKSRLHLQLSQDALLLYGVNYESVVQVLRTAFGDNSLGLMRSEQEQIPITLIANENKEGIQSILNTLTVVNGQNQLIPVKSLVTYKRSFDFGSLYLGKTSSYIPLTPLENQNVDIEEQQNEVARIIPYFPHLRVNFDGSHFQNIEYLNQISYIVLIAIGLLFFILAAQFESLQQPFIVLMTIVFGSAGALIGLYLSGSSLNIMSMIGFVVLIGLLDNDSILKIDTMNKSANSMSIMDTIRIGGQKRLHSQLMTFFTTILGLIPILWSSGLGAELQKPLAVTVISGMIVGVLISWTFIPLTYHWLHNLKKK